MADESICPSQFYLCGHSDYTTYPKSKLTALISRFLVEERGAVHYTAVSIEQQ